jgi:hypothetical protein
MLNTWNESIVRSIQKAFQTAWAADSSFASVRVFYGGEKEAPQSYPERVHFDVNGPHWKASRSSPRQAEVALTFNCFTPRTTNVHRIHSLAGAIATALDRKAITVCNYPASATQIGWVRLGEAKIVDLGESLNNGETPVMQAAVTFEGVAELT